MSLQRNKGGVGRDIGAARTRQRHRHVLDDAPGGRAHDQHAVGEEDRLVNVMGDEQDRGLELGPEPQQVLLHHRARLRIERTEGLVHQQDGRLVGERPRDADPLLHATRKLGRIAMGETGKADHIEQFVGDGARPGPPFPLGIGSECDVVPDRLPREQRVLLEYHATIGTGADNLISVNPDPSGGRANIAGDRVEQCGFAAARGTEQAHERARADIDGRVFERTNGLAAAAKPYRYVPNLDAPAIERRPSPRKARHIDG